MVCVRAGVCECVCVCVCVYGVLADVYACCCLVLLLLGSEGILQPAEERVPGPLDLCCRPAPQGLVQEGAEHLAHLLPNRGGTDTESHSLDTQTLFLGQPCKITVR